MQWGRGGNEQGAKKKGKGPKGPIKEGRIVVIAPTPMRDHPYLHKPGFLTNRAYNAGGYTPPTHVHAPCACATKYLSH